MVEGNYDPFFQDLPYENISTVYQRLGCFYSLQPDRNPYASPVIPALTPLGYVRWQTIQLLLDPQEHVPYLQKAVKNLPLKCHVDNKPFPKELPKESLPTQADQGMCEWHERMLYKIGMEAQAAAWRELPLRPRKALSDGDVGESRDSSLSSTSLVGTKHRSSTFPNNRTPRPSSRNHQKAPWSQDRRHSRNNSGAYPTPWPRDKPKAGSFPPPPPNTRSRGHSDVSTSSSSTSDSSSYTTGSPSPVRQRSQQPPRSPFNPPPPFPPRPRSANAAQPRPMSFPSSYVPPPSQPHGPPNQNQPRWQGAHPAFASTPNFPGIDPRMGRGHGQGYDLRNVRTEERGRGRTAKSADPTTGLRESR